MDLQDLNLQVVLPLIAIELILMVIALVDLARRETIRGPKLMWVFIIIVGNLLGTIIYFTIGRKNEA